MIVYDEQLNRTDLAYARIVGQGLQGTVFAHGNVAIKICHDDRTCPPPTPGRIDDLRTKLGKIPGLVLPTGVVRTRDGQIVGYTMPLVTNARPLRYVKLSRAKAVGLLVATARLLDRVNDAWVLIGDMLENILLSDDDEIIIIDSDGWRPRESYVENDAHSFLLLTAAVCTHNDLPIEEIVEEIGLC